MNFAFLTTALIVPLGLIGGCGAESSHSTSGSEGGVPVDDAPATGDVAAEGGGGSGGSGSEGGGSTSSGASSSGASSSGASSSGASSSGASSSGASSSGASSRDSGARACEMQACFRANECVTACGGPVTNTGCCPCEPPAFDLLTCNADAAAGPDATDSGAYGCTANAAQDAMCGGQRPAHFYVCVFPYKQPNGCTSLTIGNATDTYCCP